MRAKTAVLLAALGFVAALTAPRAATPPDDKAIAHVLNRIGYGPRPGDVEKVRRMGLQKYIDEQLHPERIADSAMDARLSSFTTLRMSSSEISEQYELPQLEQRRLRQQAARGADPDAAMPGARRPGAPGPDGAMIPERGRGRGRGDLAAMQQPPQQPAAAVINELQEQKLLRAVYSERQLQEVLTDFWFNHFNVDARKGRDRFLLTAYERDAIRPHVLGSFRDLLGATAKSPAMLFYLDNFMSVDPNASGPGARGQRPPIAARGAQGRGAQGRGALGRGGQGRGGQGRGLPGGAGRGFPMPGGGARGRGGDANMQPPAPANRAPRGLNENYGRELMELHTLGVDGGYTQKDVTEVARALTGWTLDNPRQGSSFRFDERLHDNGEKIVLGHKIKSGGIKDGEDVLDILASHPSTARFIATKLARRFVSDTPSPALVDRLAKKFHDTKGDLREVTRALLTSPEFLSPAAYDAKVKTPLEFVVSAARATGAGLTSAQPLVRALQQLGMPLYECQPPTGYKDTADAWTNTGALVARMNFATTLASNRQFGIAGGQLQSMSSPDTVIDTILGGAVSETTRATIAKASSVPQMVALTLGSPEFQRR